MPSIDDLYIEIDANSAKANDAIDRLVLKLDRLSVSLGKINGSGLTGLANGVQRLGVSMQTINNTKTNNLASLTNGIAQLSNLKYSDIGKSALVITTFGKAVKSLSDASASSKAIGTMAGNIAKLGTKSGTQAITNIPLLANALDNLFATLAKTPQINRNIVDMTNALASLASQGSRVGTASNSIVYGMGQTSSSVKRTRKHVLSLASAFGRFYASYFLVIRGLKGLWNSIETTADYIEAFNYYNVAFGKIASEWQEDWEKYGYENAETYAESFTERMEETFSKLSGLEVDTTAGLLSETGLKNLGLNIQEVTQYASQLASVTNSIGQTGETTLAISTAFTKLAGDISSLFNVDFQTVSKNLQSGLIGQSRALYKYGIDITNATLQTKAYELGLEKSVSEMIQMEKQQLRVLSILEQSKVSWGDLANTINSPSNMIRQLTNNLKEAGIVLGQLFIPVLEKGLPVINGFAIAIKRLLVNIAQILGININFDAFGQGYSDLEYDVDGITDSMNELEESAKKAQASLRGFDELKVISLSAGTTSADGLENTIDLTEEIINATEEYETVWNQAFTQMENKAQTFADNISSIFYPIESLIENLFSGDFEAAGWDVSNMIDAIIAFMDKAIEDVEWDKIGEKIGNFIKGINWTEKLKGIADLIWDAIDAAIDTWKGAFKTAPIETAIITALAIAKFTGLGDSLSTAISNSLSESGVSLKTISVSVTVGLIAINWVIEDLPNLAVDFGQWFTKQLTGKEITDEQYASVLEGTGILPQDFGLIIESWMETGSILTPGVKELMSKVGTMFVDGIKSGFASAWEEFEKWFENSSIPNWLKEIVEPLFSVEEWTWDGIAEGLGKSFSNAVEALKEVWNTFAENLNKKLELKIDPIKVLGKEVFPGTTVKLGKIPTFATGGFPTKGDLFYANEMGPELIGTMNGKTAVASNGEITGISDAIYSTGQTEASLLQTAVGLLQIIAEKEYGITDRQIGESARRYASDYHSRTGDYAFI